MKSNAPHQKTLCRTTKPTAYTARARAVCADWRSHRDDQPTIGLLLCQEKNRLTVEYALRDLKKPIGVSEWRTHLVESLPKELRGSLPSVEELETELGAKKKAKR